MTTIDQFFTCKKNPTAPRVFYPTFENFDYNGTVGKQKKKEERNRNGN